MRARRNSASASARSTIPSSSRRARGSSRAARVQAAGAGGSIPIRRESRSMSYPLITSPALRTRDRARFFHERVAKLVEAAGDAARDRPGRQLERLADRAVALVAGEEAVQDLA